MIHARPDYNRIQDPENNIPRDMPVFLLLGCDRYAADTVRFWASQVEESGGDPAMVRMAREHADRMASLAHHKEPDLPSHAEPGCASAMSPRLLALLRAFKRNKSFADWRQIAEILGDLYHPKMSFEATFGHLVAAHLEALSEPRFQLNAQHHGIEHVFLAPVRSTHALKSDGPLRLDTDASIEAFYTAIMAEIHDILAFCTNIGWCRAEIYPEEQSQP